MTPHSPGELLRVFSAVAIQGFGGVLPVAQRELVERRQWLTRDEFIETLSIGQVLPGPNIVNVGLIVGDRFFGWRGAFAALAGLLALPLAIVLALAALYARFAAEPMVAGALRGMAAVAAGLIIAMAFKLLPTLAKNPLGRTLCRLALLATLASVGALRWPMAYAVIGIGGVSVFAAWWRLGPQP
ncbi:MAG: chromate transporter [Burkholderiaceae bacterium]|nr:chromate transporter [Burkholderiaceae bacterium]